MSSTAETGATRILFLTRDRALYRELDDATRATLGVMQSDHWTGPNVLVESGANAATSTPTSSERVTCTDRQNEYDLRVPANVEAGLDDLFQARRSGQPYALVIVDDQAFDDRDGIDVIHDIWHTDPEVQTILLAESSDGLADEIITRLGISDRILLARKPLDSADVTLMVLSVTHKWHLIRHLNSRLLTHQEQFQEATQVLSIIESCEAELEAAQVELKGMTSHLSDRLQQRTAEILETRNVTVFALAKLAESRDQETGDHLQRLREFAQILALQLAEHGPYQDEINDNFLHDFYLSTPLHDIGKVGISDNILLKPGKLTEAEFEKMKQHTVIGADALTTAANRSQNNRFFRMAAAIARYHHERYDGTGYPEGLSGRTIPLAARIVSVADVFDALISRRVYKEPYPPEQAARIIREGSGSHFDPVVVDTFLRCIDRLLEARDDVANGQTPAAPELQGCLV